MLVITQIVSPQEKSYICNGILHALPSWFGVEASIVDYAEKVKSMPFWAAFAGALPVGFVAVKEHNPYTAEVCVMGVLKEYHRHGIGKRFIGCCESYCADRGMEYLTVKTLDGSVHDDGYARTRQFYLAMGFRPLEVFPLYWDEDNPCLFMVKHLAD